MSQVMHGWYNYYSSFTCFYLKEDGSGEVEVSFVEDDYDDKKKEHNIYVGKVTEYVRQGRTDAREEAWLNKITRIVQDFRPKTQISTPEELEQIRQKVAEKNAFCPLAYTGAGNCTCGKCQRDTRQVAVKVVLGGPFGYTEDDQKSWTTHPVTPSKQPLHLIHDEPPKMSWQERITQFLQNKSYQ